MASTTPEDALAVGARRTVRIQIAAATAAVTSFAGWARAADTFAQAVGEELVHCVHGDIDSRELVDRVASAANAHLRELTALPRAAVNHFNARILAASINQ